MEHAEGLKFNVLKAIAKGIYGVAEISAGKRCIVISYEPQIPEELKTKNNDFKEI